MIDGSYTLVKGVDYTVTYTDNINVGEATVVITGIGNYQGTQNKTFNIIKASSIITCSNPTYSGEAIVVGTCAGGELTNDTGINAGSYDLSCIGDSNHNDATETCSISRKALPSATLSETQFTYDGNAQEPNVIMTDGSYTLVKDTDFTVVYSNNTEVGTATATITGIGNYEGSQSRNFTIAVACVPKSTGTKSIYRYGEENTAGKSATYTFTDNSGTIDPSSISATTTDGNISCSLSGNTVTCRVTNMTIKTNGDSGSIYILKDLLSSKYSIAKDKIVLASTTSKYPSSASDLQIEYIWHNGNSSSDTPKWKYYARKTYYSGTDLTRFQGPTTTESWVCNYSYDGSTWPIYDADYYPERPKEKIAYHCYNYSNNNPHLSYDRVAYGTLTNLPGGGSSSRACKCYDSVNFKRNTPHIYADISVSYCVK